MSLNVKHKNAAEVSTDNIKKELNDMVMMLKMSNDQISQFIQNNNLGNNIAYKKSR